MTDFNQNTITQSSLTIACECMRQYKHKIMDCLYRNDYEEPQYFIDGMMFHAFMETGEIPTVTGADDAKLHGICQAYTAFYQDDMLRGEHEKIFHIPVKDIDPGYTGGGSVDGYSIAGVIDLTNEFDIYVADHKLLSPPG